MSQDNPFTSTTQTSIVSEQLQKAKVVGLSADAIEAAFAPMVNMLRVIESEYDKIVIKPINTDTIAEAKELRMRMVKIRTGTDKIHTEQKAEFLIKGRAVDAIKNVLTAAVYDKEKKLSEIENHFINIEKEVKMKLFNERQALLEPFIGGLAMSLPLGELDEDSFNNMLNGYILAAEERTKREAREEQEKKEAEERKVLEDKHIREENEKLKKQNDLFIKRAGLLMQCGAIHTIRDSDNLKGFQLIRLKDSAVLFAPEETIRNCDDDFFSRKIILAFNEYLEDNKDTQQIAWEAEQKKIKLSEEKLKIERAERKRLENEIAENAAQEEIQRKAILSAKRKTERAPDKEKLLGVVNQILLIDFPSCKDEDAKKIMSGAQDLLAKTIKYITDNADRL